MKKQVKKTKPKSEEELHEMISNIPLPQPSSKMDERFRLFLQEEKKKSLLGESIKERKTVFRPTFLPYIRIAAGIALFMMGWFGATWKGTGTVGYKQLTSLSSEVSRLRETLVLSMIQQNSPVERIKAVHMASQMDQADESIIESLLLTLDNDDNENVRLIALEALIRYSENSKVREGLIRTISKQSSPMIQLRLAEIMVSLQEKRSVPEFQKVLHNTNLNYSVRNKLDETVQILI